MVDDVTASTPVAAETTAGDNVAERAGRLRIAELHNSLCNGVLAVRAGARAAHKSAAGAGAAAVEAAAQSFQRNMQVRSSSFSASTNVDPDWQPVSDALLDVADASAQCWAVKFAFTTSPTTGHC